MHKHLINAFAVITAGPLNLSAFILPPQARSQETGQSCEIALLNAKKRIEQGREITVTMDIKDSSEEYPDHPDGRPTIIFLFLDFPGSDRYGNDGGGTADDAASVMESPVFQRAIASQIIKSCNSVGAVTFFLNGQPPWINTIGLMRDGSIQNFECLFPDELPDDGSLFLPWGQEPCSI